MNDSTTFQGFLDQQITDARAEIGLPPSPAAIPSLASIMGAIGSRAAAELADGSREIERGNVLAIDYGFLAHVESRIGARTSRDVRTPILDSTCWPMMILLWRFQGAGFTIVRTSAETRPRWLSR